MRDRIKDFFDYYLGIYILNFIDIQVGAIVFLSYLRYCIIIFSSFV